MARTLTHEQEQLAFRHRAGARDSLSSAARRLDQRPIHDHL